jgi:integrase
MTNGISDAAGAPRPPVAEDGSQRILSLLSKTAIHELHPDNPYMFPSPVTGTMYHPDAAGRIHRKLLREAGIEPVRFHDLRHPNVKPKTNFF